MRRRVPECRLVIYSESEDLGPFYWGLTEYPSGRILRRGEDWATIGQAEADAQQVWTDFRSLPTGDNGSVLLYRASTLILALATAWV